MVIRPYILAGGRSSRMGRDKAMLPLAGRTMLGRAVDTLRGVTGLKDPMGTVLVTVVGERGEIEGADRVIADRYPGCGPMGGMETALRDLGNSSAEAEWAFFLPVDMPFLSSGLIDALLREWVGSGAKVCHTVVDGQVQPLVSLMHCSLHPFLREALTAGRFKVTPVLKSACEILALKESEGLGCSHMLLHETEIPECASASSLAGWVPTEEQERSRRLWFSNLNDEQDFAEAETFLKALG